MKCPSCNRRKGKRQCPGLNGQICPLCCGEKRVVEIPCPSSCPFLTSGQEYHLHKKFLAIIQNIEEPAKRERLFKALRNPKMILAKMEQSVVEYSSGLTSLKDRDVLASYKLIRGTYHTENKGVIYEHTSSNPLVQSLSRKLRQDIETHREFLAEKGAQPQLQEILDCLELAELDVTYYTSENSDGTGYLDFAKRNYPELKGERSDSGIIVTG